MITVCAKIRVVMSILILSKENICRIAILSATWGIINGTLDKESISPFPRKLNRINIIERGIPNIEAKQEAISPIFVLIHIDSANSSCLNSSLYQWNVNDSKLPPKAIAELNDEIITISIGTSKNK